MDIDKLFDALYDYEKSILFDVATEWHYNRKIQYDKLLKRNREVIFEWSNKKASNRLMTSLSIYFTNLKIELDYCELNQFELSDLKIVRNVGSSSINEFLSYKQ